MTKSINSESGGGRPLPVGYIKVVTSATDTSYINPRNEEIAIRIEADGDASFTSTDFTGEKSISDGVGYDIGLRIGEMITITGTVEITEYE